MMKISFFQVLRGPQRRFSPGNEAKQIMGCAQWWLWHTFGMLSMLQESRAPAILKDGSDFVNVISVENMDALLRLRLAPAGNGSGLTGGGSRTRRAEQKKSLCDIDVWGCVVDRIWINATCSFNDKEVNKCCGDVLFGL